jgi:hypothetical protein
LSLIVVEIGRAQTLVSAATITVSSGPWLRSSPERT